MKNLQPLKIMIVEDETDLRLLYREVLPKDWKIDFFDNAREAAIHFTAKSSYDLVITDLKMNTKTGEGLIYDIKYINPHQKIIVVSGHIDDLNIPKEFRVKVFEKPWDIRKVIDVFNNWDQTPSGSDSSF